jgi:enoyl-CoA hydratase/carnithine racemase
VADSLQAALAALEPGTRVVVLRGRGDRGFSAGADIAAFQDGAGAAPQLQELARTIETLAVPVVAAVHGYCLGGGFELALACDIRVVQADARIALPEVKLGLIPGGGGTQRLPRIAGRGRAAWMLMSGEQISGTQAGEWGIADFVADDLDAEVERIAGALAGQSGSALAALKEVLAATRDTQDDGAELEIFKRCLQSPDGVEGIAAFLEKREPRFS